MKKMANGGQVVQGPPISQGTWEDFQKGFNGQKKAEGGEIEGPEGEDGEEIMDHVASECMHALSSGDKDLFKDAMHVMIAHVMSKLSSEMEEGEEV